MKYFIFSLTFLIFLVLVFIYINISKPIEITKQEKENNKNNSFTKFEILKPKLKYSFPVRILYMKIDFQKFKYIIIYKVVLKNFDKFAFFNIKTILDSNNIHYSLFKRKKGEIYIFFKNLSEANSVINLFKEYNFNIKIQKIKKRI